ncbi:MAG: alpha-galactosidase, partial [Erysipelotrichaceae bacterium]|nr:alpha-galactosidase [Erysipelotrichaceae bacterium]
MIKECLKNRVLRFAYKVNNLDYQFEINSNFENQHCVVIQDLNDSLLSIRILPKCSITIESLELKLNYKFTDELIYVNGYQSWTDSKEFFVDEKMKTLSRLAKPLLPHYQFDKYGDYNFKTYSNIAGDFHGYTYGYIRSGNNYQFIGSLSEKEGYTIINTSVRNNEIVIEKECKDHVINSEYHAFNLFFMTGSENVVFDTYFEKMRIKKPTSKPMTGWTSWYNYYQNISESI